TAKPGDAYDNQAAYFVECLRNGIKPTLGTPEQARLAGSDGERGAAVARAWRGGQPMSKLTALAIVAHPDDIEFTMAGTLLLLKDGGADIHFWNLANGCYGSMVHSQADITRIRAEEARAAAKLAGATIHPSITDDLNIFHTPELIAKVTSTVRAVKPQIILTHSPQDYMEDHMNAARLAVTGAFIRAAPNYVSDPPAGPWSGDTVVYHAMPHGLRGPLRERIRAELYVDIGMTLASKG